MDDGKDDATDEQQAARIMPAGRLYLAIKRRNLDAKARLIINAALANEVAASRDLIKITKREQGGGIITLIPNAERGCADRYGDARVRTDEVLANEGISPEIVRYAGEEGLE